MISKLSNESYVRYYPIHTIRIDNDRWDAFCVLDEFKKYRVSYDSGIKACVLMTDVIISVCNKFLSKNKKLPLFHSDSYDYLKIQNNNSEFLCWMPLIIINNINSNEDLINFTNMNDILVLPPEYIWTKKAIKSIEEYENYKSKSTDNNIEKYSNRSPVSNVGINGYYLPVIIPMDYTLLKETMTEILMRSNYEYLIKKQLNDFDKLPDILDICSNVVLKMIRDEITQYSMDNIYKWLLPQIEVTTYLKNHQIEESKTNIHRTTAKEKKADESYFAAHSIIRDELLLAQKQLMDIVAAEPPFGNNKLRRNDYSKLIALAHHFHYFMHFKTMIEQHYRFDSIYFSPYGIKAYDCKIDNMKSLQMKIGENSINNYNTFNKYCSDLKKIRELNSSQKEDAFSAEFGLSFSDIEKFTNGLLYFCQNDKKAYHRFNEREFRNFMMKKYNWSDEMCSSGLDIFCLNNRERWDNIPKESSEWDYINPANQFAEYSSRRRSMIRYISPNQDIIIYYSKRNFAVGWNYIQERIYDDKYKPQSKEMRVWINRLRNEEAKIFQNTALKIIVDELKLEVRPNQKPHKLFNLNKDYGDIDLAVLDYDNNIFYSIECKNISQSFNVRQKNNEYSKFGVIENKKKNEFVDKHKMREMCLNDHLDELQTIYKFKKKPKVVSLFLTNMTIDSQASIDDLPIPIISISALMTYGIDALKSCIKL